jgi:membrane-associated PAP2 superfamily phosphatase
MAFFAQVALVDRTFRTYRRGWRLTMLALAITVVAGVLLGLKILGISPPLSILPG